jgi:hypothetical protein
MVKSRWLIAAAVAGAIMLNAAGAFAGVTYLDKCQAKIMALTNALGTKYTAAIMACANAIRAEKAKDLKAPGSGVLAKAAKACEGKLLGMYDVANSKGKSEITKYRVAIEKLRTSKISSSTCEDCTCTDAALSGLSFLLLSGGGAAPPAVGDKMRFTEDYLVVQTEAGAIQNAMAQVPDLINLIGLAKEAPNSNQVKCDDDPTKCDATDCSVPTHPNLCAFDVECREHACQLSSTGSGTCMGGSNDGTACTSNATCVPPGAGKCVATSGAAIKAAACAGCTIAVPLTGRSTFGICTINGALAGTGAALPTGYKYMVGGAANVIGEVNTNPDLPAHVCVSILRSSGWCNCSGSAGPPNNLAFCQDREATGQATDDCTAPAATQSNDPVYAGTKVGQVVVTASGSAGQGHCVDMLTVQFRINTNTSQGPDLVFCTSDDTKAPSAPSPVPLTTGTARATLKEALVAEGACSDAGAAPCVGDENCTAPATCVGASLADMSVGTITGVPGSCTGFETSTLSGLKLVGAFPSGGGNASTLGDTVTGFQFTCQ